jgi:hypothetical protein
MMASNALCRRIPFGAGQRAYDVRSADGLYRAGAVRPHTQTHTHSRLATGTARPRTLGIGQADALCWHGARLSPDNPARHMRDRAVGVLQYDAERLEDVSDDARLAAGLVDLARTDGNRRAGHRASGLAAWLHPPAARGARATHPPRRQPVRATGRCSPSTPPGWHAHCRLTPGRRERTPVHAAHPP